MAGRDTFWLEHPRNVVYVRVLKVWKENATKHESMIAYAISKAMNAIKVYPQSIVGIEGLKRINGVGDVIASRLEACWDVLSFEMGDDIKCVAKVMEALTNEKIVAIFDATKKQGKHKGRVPSLKQAAPATSKAAPKRLSDSQIQSSSRPDDDEFTEKDDIIPPKMARFNSDPMLSKAPSRSNIGQTASSGPSKSMSAAKTADDSDDDEDDKGGIEYVRIEPRDNVKVILVMDNTEKSGKAKSSVVDLLEKMMLEGQIQVERRCLSIGDYMWIAKIDGREICMDWVVERKTWRDLDMSINSDRYQEQKQRLRAAPFKNKVYLIEGQREGLPKLQQALATTMVQDNFLIQRTLSCHESAEFLVSLTKRLQQQARSEKMVRPTFTSVQAFSKKSASIDRLSDIWTRMLMVVPGVSAESAQLVAARFPSIKALMTLWKEEAEPEKRLLKEVPSLGRVQADNISHFFEQMGLKK